MRASDLVKIDETDHLETLRRCDGFYQCPKDATGKHLGPLVGYAGKYKVSDDSDQMKNWVGEVYYNFAMAEMYSRVYSHYADVLAPKIREQVGEVDYSLGAPMGGLRLASYLASRLDCLYVFTEKKITAIATPTSREQSTLVLDRHSITSNSRVLLVEDVCNNFSTSEQVAELIERFGSEVVAIACGLNRSSKTSVTIRGKQLPVIALIEAPTKQYRQDDPYVAEDIAGGNIVWKPKDEWSKLKAASAA